MKTNTHITARQGVNKCVNNSQLGIAGSTHGSLYTMDSFHSLQRRLGHNQCKAAGALSCTRRRNDVTRCDVYDFTVKFCMSLF